MGQSRGYDRISTLTPGQQGFQNNALQQAFPWLNQAAQGFQQFLPGGGGGQAFVNQANQRFQQETIPTVMNAFGTGSKTNSALNQALGSSAANLNTDLASTLANAQLQAASGLGNLGSTAGNFGMQPSFALQQRNPPLWQSMLLSVIPGLSSIFSGGFGR